LLVCSVVAVIEIATKTVVFSTY